MRAGISEPALGPREKNSPLQSSARGSPCPGSNRRQSLLSPGARPSWTNLVRTRIYDMDT
jgi:hypothetical protein